MNNNSSPEAKLSNGSRVEVDIPPDNPEMFRVRTTEGSVVLSAKDLAFVFSALEEAIIKAKGMK